jgi:hypothetical protein
MSTVQILHTFITRIEHLNDNLPHGYIERLGEDLVQAAGVREEDEVLVWKAGVYPLSLKMAR